jgi:hypothetical protein
VPPIHRQLGEEDFYEPLRTDAVELIGQLLAEDTGSTTFAALGQVQRIDRSNGVTIDL